MKCVLCEHYLYDKFNHNLIVGYCDSCKLEHATFNIFKNIVLEILLTDKAYSYIKDVYKSIMINNLQDHFWKENFGLICKVDSCKLDKNCTGSVKLEKRGACYIYQYNYNGFKFYYCYYNKLIIYNPKDINILLQYLYKEAKKIRKKERIIKFFKSIKRLFIKEEKEIKEDVKK